MAEPNAKPIQSSGDGRDAQIATLTAERDEAQEALGKMQAYCATLEDQISNFGLQPAPLVPKPFTPVQPTPHASLAPTDGRTGITSPA